MLKGISPLISPELLKVLASMGHGDEIVLADAHFPGHTMNTQVLRADGLKIPDLLAAILPLFELDQYVPHPLAMMAAVEGDQPLLTFMISLKSNSVKTTHYVAIDTGVAGG